MGYANPLLHPQINQIEYVVDTMLEENVHDILCSRWWMTVLSEQKVSSKAARNILGFWPAGRHCQPRQQPGGSEKLVFEQGAIGQQQLAAALAMTSKA